MLGGRAAAAARIAPQSHPLICTHTALRRLTAAATVGATVGQGRGRTTCRGPGRAVGVVGRRGLAADVRQAWDVVDEAISDNDIVVFSSPTCGYCRKVLASLDKHGHTPHVVTVSPPIRRYLMEITDQRSVPQVFVKGEFVGGCYDGGMGGTIPLLKNGTIAEMLQQD